MAAVATQMRGQTPFAALEDALLEPAFAARAAAAAEIPVAEVQWRLRNAVEEGRHAQRLLAGHSLEGRRVLEVGAGLGVFSAWLAHQGADLLAIEPGGEGHEAHQRLARQVFERAGLERERLLPVRIQELATRDVGDFDLIFSLSVLEHVEDVEECLAQLARLLRPHGRMVHSCPNYRVPFEPHFGIPLVPFAPAVTRFVLPRRIRDSGVWRSLNFVTLGDVRRASRRLDGAVDFAPGLLYDAFLRLERDPAFRDRHRGPVLRLFRLLRATGLLGALRLLPAGWSTPMVFTWANPGKEQRSGHTAR